jgi:hypothetical protein
MKTKYLFTIKFPAVTQKNEFECIIQQCCMLVICRNDVPLFITVFGYNILIVYDEIGPLSEYVR